MFQKIHVWLYNQDIRIASSDAEDKNLTGLVFKMPM